MLCLHCIAFTDEVPHVNFCSLVNQRTVVCVTFNGVSFNFIH